MFDPRNHVAGNCHTERDPQTGILLHLHGPHIFHTDDMEVWDYVRRFATFRPFRHRVLTARAGQVFQLPIHLGTLCQFYGTALTPQAAQERVAKDIAASLPDADAPDTFETSALRLVGRSLYEAFLKGYTEKQWGVSADRLPGSILRRLPLRWHFDDSYFSHPVQAMPEDGYTSMVSAMLDHPQIELQLGRAMTPKDMTAPDTVHTFWTGTLEAAFNEGPGPLSYRTLRFERVDSEGDFQGCPVMNYADKEVLWTRIAEHKHFAPWEEHEKTIAMREYPSDARPGDVPYYPLRLVDDKSRLADYVSRAEQLERVSFAGRLGTYRYLDMDKTIREALDTARAYIAAQSGTGPPMPTFLHLPL